jgi:ribokinase
MSAHVFVLGSFVVDAAFRAARLPHPGETLLGAGFALGPGGKGSNQAVACARAGASVSFLTAVGEDAFGQLGRDTWAAEGIDATLVKTSASPTGAAAILLHEATGENAIIVVPGACSTLTAADVEAAAGAIQSAKVFVAQLEIPLETVRRGLELARAAGVPTVLNPAPAPEASLPPELLALVDFLVPNESEVARLTGKPVASAEDAIGAALHLQGQGASGVLVTLGEQGSVFCAERNPPVRIRSFQAGPVVDTTGAGDAFCGNFAAALAEGRSIPAAARFASAAAGLSVTRKGTAPAMPFRSETEALLEMQP